MQDWKTRLIPAINEYVEIIKTKAIMKAVKTANKLYLGMFNICLTHKYKCNRL